jgi:hypothetical protein
MRGWVVGWLELPLVVFRDVRRGGSGGSQDRVMDSKMIGIGHEPYIIITLVWKPI